MAHLRATDDEALFVALYPALRRFAAAIRPSGIDADDLVQEALTRTLARRSLSSIEEPLAYLRTAIVRIAGNHARGRRRADARVVRVGPPDVESADAYPSDLADLMRVQPRARAVLFLTVVEERSFADAAAVVGCSEAAARQLSSRALRSLRQELGVEVRNGDPA
jgi:DNA-directed RNA polymerase specialized sigma24 family protein